jgi:hypothetical protein
MKTKGNFSISRLSCSDGRSYIRINVTEEASRVQFLELEVELADFAKALTGLGYQECDLELRRLDLLGKQLEIKTEVVPRPKGWKVDESEVKRILAPFEVDGWLGCTRDLCNHHNWVGQDKVSVVFHRYVDKQKDGE